jgi:outer membrane protein
MKRTFLALLAALMLAAGTGFASPEEKTPLVLTLDDCLRLALERNPAFLAIRETEPGARARLHEAAAQFFPSLDAQGTNIVSKKPFEILFPSMIPGEPPQRVKVDFTRNYQLTLSFSLPLFAGGRLTAGYRQADYSLQATRESIRQSRQETILNVKRTFYGNLLARRFVEVSEEALTLAEGHYKNVKNLAEVGMASKFDLLRSEVETANLKPQLLRARNSLAVAGLGLKTLLGLDLEEPVEIRGELSFTPAELDVDGALEEALARRPDLAQVRLQRRIAGEVLKIARGSGLPTLALGGAYNTWADALKFTKGTWESYYTVSLVLNVPLFRGLTSHAQVSQSKALVRQLEYTQKGFAEIVKFEVRQAVLNYNQARETLASQEKNVDQAREAVRIAEVNYREGLATNLDVSGAQVALSQARTNHAQALYDCAVALAELEKAVGGSGNETESN